MILSASPERGSSFSGWSGGGCTGACYCIVSMDSERIITANFASLPQYNLSVTLNGTGSVVSSPESVDGNILDCTSGTCIKQYFQDDIVTLTATEDRSSDFVGWSGACNPTANPYIATVDMGSAAKTCTAEFANKIQYNLGVSFTGHGTGTVTSSPVSADGNAINCPATSCLKWYFENEKVTLNAVANADSAFIEWSGDADCSDGNITMNSNKIFTAKFDLLPHTLTVNNIAMTVVYGVVSSSPAGINCYGYAGDTNTCDASFAHNTTVTLTANLLSGGFAGWSGDCVVTANPNVALVVLDDVKSCSALFFGAP